MYLESSQSEVIRNAEEIANVCFLRSSCCFWSSSLSVSLPFLFSFSFFFSFFVLTVIAFTRPVQLSRCKKSTCLLTLDWTFKTNYLRILGRVLKQFSLIFWLLKQEHNLVRTTLHPFHNTKKSTPHPHHPSAYFEENIPIYSTCFRSEEYPLPDADHNKTIEGNFAGQYKAPQEMRGVDVLKNRFLRHAPEHQ